MPVLLVLLLSLFGDLNGSVVGVTDGDTITILEKFRTVRIRLFGVDCPEKRQPFGEAAKKRVSALCYRTHIHVQTKGKDSFGRTLGIVFLKDGRNLNNLLVKEGLAWWYRKYSPRDKKLQSLEAGAKRARRGLWSVKNPIPPWEFRRKRKSTGLLVTYAM